jgi:hypothetical protein
VRSQGFRDAGTQKTSRGHRCRSGFGSRSRRYLPGKSRRGCDRSSSRGDY